MLCWTGSERDVWGVIDGVFAALSKERVQGGRREDDAVGAWGESGGGVQCTPIYARVMQVDSDLNYNFVLLGRNMPSLNHAG